MAKDVMSNSNGASLSVLKHNALLSNLKNDAAQAHTEMLEAKGTISISMSSYSGFFYIF